MGTRFALCPAYGFPLCSLRGFERDLAQVLALAVAAEREMSAMEGAQRLPFAHYPPRPGATRLRLHGGPLDGWEVGVEGPEPPGVRVVVIRAAGPTFSAGIDLRLLSAEGVPGEEPLPDPRSEGFEAWIAEWVTGMADRASYLQKLGRRWDALRVQPTLTPVPGTP